MNRSGDDRPSTPSPAFPSGTFRQFQISINLGVPLAFSELPNDPQESPPSQADALRIAAVGKTLNTYLLAARRLLDGQYAEMKQYAPPHLVNESLPTAIICNDGVLVRYELGSNPDAAVRVGLVSGDVAELAPLLSESIVHCPRDPKNFVPPSGGVELNILAETSATGEKVPIAKIQAVLIVALPTDSDRTVQSVGGWPATLASIQKDVEIMLAGQTGQPATSEELGAQGFLVRGPFSLPVGWQAIEIYPPFDSSAWRPEIAPAWAESDLLAYAARRHLREDRFRALDPNQLSRARFGSLLTQLRNLLSGPEEPVHQFLKQHPQLLSPTHLRCWSKLRVGRHVTDFVFLEPGGNYLFVELEAPSQLLFRDDGQVREELVHAWDQVTDWQRYIEDNLRTVQQELGLTGLSTSPRFLIVMGRSTSLTDETKRKLVTLQNQIPKLTIMTYDDLLMYAKSAVENLLGPLWEVGENVSIYYYPMR